MSQHAPDVHCGTTHDPPKHPYVQSLHHAELVFELQYCPVVQSVVGCHGSFCVAPSQDAVDPEQYLCHVRSWALSPHPVPLHPYSIPVSHWYVLGR